MCFFRITRKETPPPSKNRCFFIFAWFFRSFCVARLSKTPAARGRLRGAGPRPGPRPALARGRLRGEGDAPGGGFGAGSAEGTCFFLFGGHASQLVHFVHPRYLILICFFVFVFSPSFVRETKYTYPCPFPVVLSILLAQVAFPLVGLTFEEDKCGGALCPSK